MTRVGDGIIIFVLVLGACGGDERVSHDLVELFDGARVVYETASVDFGESGARAHFVSGFSQDETDGDGVTYVWSEGGESELRIAIGEPRALSLTFRCWPFRFEGAPAQTLTLVLNEHDVAEIELAPEPGEYHVALPVAHQLAGDNRLRFRYRYRRTPSDVIPGARDDRPLAVAWDWLRVDGALPPSAPVAGERGGSGALTLPEGVRVDYFIDPLPDSRFVVDAVGSTTGGALVVTAETLTERAVISIEAPAAYAELELPSAGTLARVSLRASSGDLVIRRPSVVTSGERAEVAVPVVERRPNIIVYLIDTLRADHLSCYGYSRPSPRIDRLAADGTLFETALAQSSWTKPSTASLLTGLHPRAHNANEREDALPSTVPSLPEILQTLGYDTAGLVVNANVSATFGFDRGFDTFELLMHEDGIVGARDDRLVDRAIEWLDQRPEDAPFFLYVHAAEPHDPYGPYGPYGPNGFYGEGFGSVGFMESLEDSRVTLSEDELARLVDFYDEDVAFADAQLGRFVDALEAGNLYDDALIVLVSDHGEEFHDHGRWRHGKTLYDEQLHVPLIIKWPRGAGAGRRVPDVVQHIDLVPTILDYLGRPDTRSLPGRSLWRLVGAEPPDSEPAVLSYLRVDDREVESVVYDGAKLVRYFDYDREVPPYQLFDLDSDPEETNDLAREALRRTDLLLAFVRHARTEPIAPRVPVELDEDVERQLRALGYIR